MKVPGGASVNESLVAVKKSLKACLQEVNQQAGKLLSRGNYARAESLVEVAKLVDAFHTEVERLHARWREIKGTGGTRVKADRTPLWEYYQPILRSLEGLGGEARLDELVEAVGREMNGRFKPGDVEVVARGKPRWQVMIRRARKHMAKEGFVEPSTGGVWRLTPTGGRAAASGMRRQTESR